jgi:hypothetical protein
MDMLELWDEGERCTFLSLLELILQNCCKLEQVTQSPLTVKANSRKVTRFPRSLELPISEALEHKCKW